MRKEIKYAIDRIEYSQIQQILNVIMKKDKNSKEIGTYKVRTIYFDNYIHEMQNDKKNDINAVRKYRIRMYNNEDEKIFLERKTNENDFIKKVKHQIKKEDVRNILQGKYKDILDENETLKMEFYLNINLKQIRPVLLVEYEREAFVDEISKVRITIDKNIKSTTNCNKFFDKIEEREGNKYILEIKYEKYLPDYINNIVKNIKGKKIEKLQIMKKFSRI